MKFPAEQLDYREEGRLTLPLSGSPVFRSPREQRDDVFHTGPLCGRGGGLELEGEGCQEPGALE